ncbi:MAG: aminotransferase class V-fold PLP-dependent enzyme [Flavobacteriaceae bacterium]|nr:aminotransferase class V-fold PLP-dependent enzyme [Flavobacteriaceae bacterium]
MHPNLKEEFPVLRSYTYLNTPASGLLSESLMECRQNHDIDYLIGGSLFRDTHKPFLESVRKTVADFFKANAANTVLIPNFSFGFRVLLECFPEKTKFLVVEDDYPTLIDPLNKKKFQLFYAANNATLEENIEKAIETHQPEVLAISLVQYIDGKVIDFQKLRSIKQKHPKLLIIADGTQFFGTEVFDFDNSPIDAVGASGYKWLLGGYGNGFFMFKESFKKQFFPSGQDEFIAHFESGHQDTFNYGSLQFSLQYLKKTGMETIQNHIRELSERAFKGFVELNLLRDDTLQRTRHSAIFNLKGDEKLLEYLKQKDILAAFRGDGIRVGFHFYNTQKDVDKLLDALRKYIRK